MALLSYFFECGLLCYTISYDIKFKLFYKHELIILCACCEIFAKPLLKISDKLNLPITETAVLVDSVFLYPYFSILCYKY